MENISSQPEKLPVRKRRSERRRREELFMIRVDTEEKLRIENNSAAVNLPVADFLRKLGQGFVPESKIDQAAIRELCLAIGDLGRLGGLLKLWMGEKRSSAEAKDSVDLRSIEEVWQDIQSITGYLKERVKSL